MALAGAAALGLCTCVGCGSVYVEGDGDGGAGALGGSGGTGGTGGSGASAGTGGTGGQEVCSEYLDADATGDVTMRFVNESGLPIYLPAVCGFPLFDLRPLTGDDGIDYSVGRFCLQTCEDLQTSGIIDCAMCEPSSIRLEPGATYDVRWDGTGLERANMPLQCWAQPDSYYEGQCLEIVNAAPQMYRIQARGYDSCGLDSEACACDSTGYCVGEATGMEAWADLSDFQYTPGTMLVEVVFGVCAFPCPS